MRPPAAVPDAWNHCRVPSRVETRLQCLHHSGAHLQRDEIARPSTRPSSFDPLLPPTPTFFVALFGRQSRLLQVVVNRYDTLSFLLSLDLTQTHRQGRSTASRVVVSQPTLGNHIHSSQVRCNLTRVLLKNSPTRGGEETQEGQNGAQSHAVVSPISGSGSLTTTRPKPSTREHHSQLVGGYRRGILATNLQVQRDDGQNLRQSLQQRHDAGLCPKRLHSPQSHHNTSHRHQHRQSRLPFQRRPSSE